MKQWGVFTTKNEVEHVVEVAKKQGLDIFEVRALTFIEKLQYCKDPALFVNEPWIVMFNGSEREYRELCEKLDLTVVF